MVKKISDLPLQASPGGTAEIEINDGSVSKKALLSYLFDRTNHTGTQASSTISDLNSASITFTNKTINSASNTLTIAKNDVTGAPTGNFVGTSDTQTMSNKSIDPYLDFLDTTIPSDPGTTTTGRMYVKQVDANNQGLFIKIKQAGSIVEVQIV